MITCDAFTREADIVALDPDQSVKIQDNSALLINL
jgi:hypothetical protein